MPDPTTEPLTSQPAPAAPAAAQTPAQDGADKPAAGADSGAAEPSAKELSEFARHRAGLREKARQLRTGFGQLKEREKALAERDAAREKELTDLRARVEKWEKGNPLEHVADPSQTVRDYVEKTAPERRIDQLEKALAEANKKLEEVPGKLEELEKKRASEIEQGREQAMAAHLANERAHFVRAIRERAAEFPYLHSELEDDEIAAKAGEIQAWARKNGRHVPFDDAAKFLNEQAKRVYETKSERRKVLTPGEQVAPSSTERSGKKTPPGPGPRADRPPPATPPKGRRAQAEEDERYVAMIQEAQAKDRVAAEKANGAPKRS